jgi:hypothetical protein
VIASGRFTSWMEFVGVTLGALLTLGVYSFLYRENKISRLCEHIFLGVAGAFAIVLTWEDQLLPKWWTPLHDGAASLLVRLHLLHAGPPGEAAIGHLTVAAGIGEVVVGVLAILLGACWYFIFSRRYLWLARLVMGIAIGATSGLAFKMSFGAQMPQIISTIEKKSLYAKVADPVTGKVALSWAQSANNIIFVAILLCVMVYFFFSFEQKNRAVRGMSRFGRWCLMITFGAYFGNTVMARMSLFIERFQFITEGWIGRLAPTAGHALHHWIHHAF